MEQQASGQAEHRQIHSAHAQLRFTHADSTRVRRPIGPARVADSPCVFKRTVLPAQQQPQAWDARHLEFAARAMHVVHIRFDVYF
eukprot:165846-Pyramimonas_sp.AAC.1